MVADRIKGPKKEEEQGSISSSAKHAITLTSVILCEDSRLVRLHVRDTDGERDGGYAQ